MKINEIYESASAGSTASGAIATMPNVVGGIHRRPGTPSLFGYTEVPKKKKKKKKKK